SIAIAQERNQFWGLFGVPASYCSIAHRLQFNVVARTRHGDGLLSCDAIFCLVTDHVVPRRDARETETSVFPGYHPQGRPGDRNAQPGDGFRRRTLLVRGPRDLDERLSPCFAGRREPQFPGRDEWAFGRCEN